MLSISERIEAVQRPDLTLVVGTLDRERCRPRSTTEMRLGDRVGQLALRALDRDDVAVELHVDAVRDGDGGLADAGHQIALTRRGRGPRRRHADGVPRGRS